MQRKGKTLKTLPDGAPRRMADGKNAFRKMSDEQRGKYLRWIAVEIDIQSPHMLTYADAIHRAATKEAFNARMRGQS